MNDTKEEPHIIARGKHEIFDAACAMLCATVARR